VGFMSGRDKLPYALANSSLSKNIRTCLRLGSCNTTIWEEVV
jgi:hypothetical protein